MSFAGEAFTKDTWFRIPTQVAIMSCCDEEGCDTFIGVAYHNEVICLCCGTVFGVEDLEEDEAVYKVLNWVNCDRYVKDCRKPFDEAADSKS